MHRRRNGRMVVAMGLGVREALTLIGLLLRMRREQARMVRRLMPRVSLVMAWSIGRRWPRPNTGQKGLEIVWGGHFCHTPRMTGDLQTRPKLEELSKALKEREKNNE